MNENLFNCPYCNQEHNWLQEACNTEWLKEKSLITKESKNVFYHHVDYL